MDLNYIDSFIKSKLQYFVDPNPYPTVFSNRINLLPVLMHTSTNRVIGVAKYYSSVEGLMDHNISDRSSLCTPNGFEDFDIENYKTWIVRYDKSKSNWITDFDLKNDEEINYFILMNQKLKMLDILVDTVCNQNGRLVYRLPYDQQLLLGKLSEIKIITDNNITTDELNEYPIISSYAKFRNITLSEAVNEMKFKIQNDFTYLSEVEYIRLKYTKIIREETDLTNLKNIGEELKNELYGYSRFGVL